MSWGGGHGRGAITIIATITAAKVLVLLGAENSECPSVSRLAQGCRKGDPQT